MNLSSVAVLTIILASTGVAAVEPLDLVTASSPAQPVTATQGGLAIAVVFPRQSTAQVVVQKGGIRRESREFEFPHAANYGATWVEHIEIKSRLSFVVHIRTRQTCSPGLYAYTFAHRGGDWLVAGLDREEHACSDEGPVPAWSKSYNFLTGRIERAQYVRGHRGKVIVERKQFPKFKLIDFQPLNAKYEP